MYFQSVMLQLNVTFGMTSEVPVCCVLLHSQPHTTRYQSEFWENFHPLFCCLFSFPHYHTFPFSSPKGSLITDSKDKQTLPYTNHYITKIKKAKRGFVAKNHNDMKRRQDHSASLSSWEMWELVITIMKKQEKKPFSAYVFHFHKNPF